MNRLSHSAASAALGAAAALALVACGKSDTTPPSVAAMRTAAAASPDKDLTAEEVAHQGRADLSCPAKVSTPARPATAPVDDVLGVRPGLAFDEAMNVVLCSHPLLVAAPATGRSFDLKTPTRVDGLRQGFVARSAEPHVVKSSKQIMKELQDGALARGGNALREDLKPGQSKWYVATMGLPGQERVLSAAREERFAEGQGPTVESVTAALLKKYGAPTQGKPAASTQLPLLRWAYDPLGRLVAEGSPLYGKCTGSSNPDGGVSLAPDCGLVVQALLIPHKANPELVDRMQVGVVDQAGGYQMIAATEQALGQADRQRRSREVEKAAKNAKAPSL